jgi:hypothetical protein
MITCGLSYTLPTLLSRPGSPQTLRGGTGPGQVSKIFRGYHVDIFLPEEPERRASTQSHGWGRHRLLRWDYPTTVPGPTNHMPSLKSAQGQCSSDNNSDESQISCWSYDLKTPQGSTRGKLDESGQSRQWSAHRGPQIWIPQEGPVALEHPPGPSVLSPSPSPALPIWTSPGLIQGTDPICLLDTVCSCPLLSQGFSPPWSPLDHSLTLRPWPPETVLPVGCLSGWLTTARSKFQRFSLPTASMLFQKCKHGPAHQCIVVSAVLHYLSFLLGGSW